MASQAARDRGGQWPQPAHRHQQPPAANASRTKIWVKPEKANSYRKQNELGRRNRNQISDKYLGAPPSSLDLHKAHLAIPLDALVGHGALLDDIRKTYKVFIEERYSALCIQGTSAPQLRQAVKAINTGLRVGRSSNVPHAEPICYVQPTFSLGELDYSSHGGIWNLSLVIPSLSQYLANLCKSLKQAIDNLVTVRQEMRLRVHFGSVKQVSDPWAVKPSDSVGSTHPRKRTVRFEKSVAIDGLPPYAKNLVTSGFQLLADRSSFTISFAVGRQRIEADVVATAPVPGTLKAFRLCAPRTLGFESQYFSMSSECPYKTYDWNMEVSSIEETGGILMDDLQQLLDSITIECSADDAMYVHSNGGAKLEHRVDSTTLTRVERFQYRDLRYVLEVRISFAWPNLGTVGEPQGTRTLSLYDPIWDVEMAALEDSQYVRSWGDALENLLPGSEASLLERFSDFVGTVWEIKEAVETALS